MNNNKWKIIGACLKGVSHQTSGQPCQDFADMVEEQGCIVAALADGLGSLSRSMIASKVVVIHVIDWLIANRARLGWENTQDILRAELLPEAVRAIQKKAGTNGDMDCNLAFLMLDQTRGYAICGHLGDCAVCVMEEGNARAYTTRGAFANATKTVLSAKPEDLYVEVVHLTERHKGFILTSDGLEGQVYRKRSGRICKSAEEIFNIPENEHEIAAQQRLDENLAKLQEQYKERFDDDISVVVVSRGTIKLPEDPTWLCTCGRRNPITSIECRNPDCGADVLKLYKRELKKYDNLEEMLLYLNADSQAEQLALETGGKPDDSSAEGLRADGRDVYLSLPEEKESSAAAELKQEAPKVESVSRKTEHKRERGTKERDKKPREKKPGITKAWPMEKKEENSELDDLLGKELPEPVKKKRKWPIILGVVTVVIVVIVAAICFLVNKGLIPGLGKNPADNGEVQIQYEQIVRDGYCWISIQVDGHEARQVLKIPYPLDTDKYGRIDMELVDAREYEHLATSPVVTDPEQTTQPEQTEPSASTESTETTGPEQVYSEKRCRLTMDISVAWSRPGGQGEKLEPDNLKMNSYVTLLEEHCDENGKKWGKIQDDTGWTGWVDMSFLQPV